MRAFLKSSRRWLTIGGFWPLVLLALPNCASIIGIEDWQPGPVPKTSAIICDIPKPEDFMQCATPADLSGIPLTYAAVALAVSKKGNNIGLDFSQDSLDMCNQMPRKITFRGTFPDGYMLCLNCGSQIPAVYPDADAACRSQCKDLINFHGELAPPEGNDDFCKNAHVSTNFGTQCLEGVCSFGGTPPVSFVDQRRNPDDVKWADESLIGTQVLPGNILRRNAATTGTETSDVNAGAASVQLVRGGDGWVEFAVGETNPQETELSHVLGLSSSCDDVVMCPDLDPSLEDFGVAISLNSDGQVYVIESDGTNLTVLGPFGTYNPGERFRLHFHQNPAGQAEISYVRVDTIGPCPGGTDCTENPLTDHVGLAAYPFRVNGSFREFDATLASVALVYIKKN